MGNGDNGIECTVARYIEAHGLLPKGRPHLVAMSGGADSVCLLLLMLRLGYTLHAAHCNFRLRGEESDRDEKFCRLLCQENNVPLHIAHFDTRQYAALHKVSIEMAARDLRYGYFRQLCKAVGAHSIVTAHHGDDNAETFLLNLIRGSGLAGLTAMKPRNGDIARPLLCVSRGEIEQWLAVNGQTYVTDSSNLVPDVMRNRIRLQVLPLLRQMNPSISDTIRQTIDRLAGAERIAAAATERYAEQCTTLDGEILTVSLAALSSTPDPQYVLHAILAPYQFNQAQINEIISHAAVGGDRTATWHAANHTADCWGDRLTVSPKLPDDWRRRHTFTLPEADTAYNVADDFAVRITLSNDTTPSRLPHIATLDADKVKFPMHVRPITPGDKFTPFGMTGRKLVSDYLADRKTPPHLRRRQLVITDADDCILWLVRQRTDQRAAVTAATKRVLTILTETGKDK